MELKSNPIFTTESEHYGFAVGRHLPPATGDAFGRTTYSIAMKALEGDGQTLVGSPQRPLGERTWTCAEQNKVERDGKRIFGTFSVSLDTTGLLEIYRLEDSNWKKVKIADAVNAEQVSCSTSEDGRSLMVVAGNTILHVAPDGQVQRVDEKAELYPMRSLGGRAVVLTVRNNLVHELAMRESGFQPDQPQQVDVVEGSAFDLSHWSARMRAMVKDVNKAPTLNKIIAGLGLYLANVAAGRLTSRYTARPMWKVAILALGLIKALPMGLNKICSTNRWQQLCVKQVLSLQIQEDSY